MITSITTVDFDPAGQIQIEPVPDTGRLVYERRSSKSATLDGFSSISDFGFTASDNTLTIKVSNPTSQIMDRLVYLIKNYPILRCANPDGVFLGSLTTIRFNLNPIEIIFDIQKQIT